MIFILEEIVKNIDTQKMPLKYKILEMNLILNKELYEDNIIDYKAFSNLQNSIIGKMKKIISNELS